MLEFMRVTEIRKGIALEKISRLRRSSVWSELTSSHNPICGHNFFSKRAGPFTYTSFCGQQFQSPIHLGAESSLTGVRKQVPVFKTEFVIEQDKIKFSDVEEMLSEACTPLISILNLPTAISQFLMLSLTFRLNVFPFLR